MQSNADNPSPARAWAQPTRQLGTTTAVGPVARRRRAAARAEGRWLGPSPAAFETVRRHLAAGDPWRAARQRRPGGHPADLRVASNRSAPPAEGRLKDLQTPSMCAAAAAAYTRPVERIMLIDAHSLIYRAYFALIETPLTTSKGQLVNAVVRLLEHRPARLPGREARTTSSPTSTWGARSATTASPSTRPPGGRRRTTCATSSRSSASSSARSASPFTSWRASRRTT